MFHRFFFLLIPQLFNDIIFDTALSTNPRIFRQLFLDPRKFLRKHLQDSVIKIQRISFPDNCPFESESRNGLRPFEGEEGGGGIIARAGRSFEKNLSPLDFVHLITRCFNNAGPFSPLCRAIVPRETAASIRSQPLHNEWRRFTTCVPYNTPPFSPVSMDCCPGDDQLPPSLLSSGTIDSFLSREFAELRAPSPP